MTIRQSVNAPQSSPPSLLVMAGGTGGHIFPGLAVAEYLRKEGWQVSWLGNPEGMEYRLVTPRGFNFEGIRFGGLRGKGLKTLLLLPFNLLRAFWQSIQILRRIKPNVVLGMGGYITFPGGMMSVLLGKPLVLHEQNSIAGLANKVLAKLADANLCAFPNSLPDATWIGNPLRESMSQVNSPTERYQSRTGVLNILVVGGSLGATALNTTIPKALSLIQKENRPHITHQSGEKHLESLKKTYEDLDVTANVLPFIEDMTAAYTQADLVICRAGAMTIAELAAVGVASYLVPFPHAVDDHQTSNAKFLADIGAAVLMPQQSFNSEKLASYLSLLDREELQKMAEQALTLAKPMATKDLAQICKQFFKDRAQV
jgi:UDP-N-acetylglucosamine--N-acetylmuramyl-(pentapeptide) pyrophosphoryl-undecaprenol N-acetylglucosamine transferase